jgi:hypothetical protein
MKKHTLYLCVTLDLDSDYVFRGDSDNPLNWKGVEFAPNIRERLAKYKDSFGNEFKATWFVRADNQLKEIYKDTSYLLNNYRDIWQSFKNEGDEFGWHPHLYRFNSKTWDQEKDDSKLKSILEDTLHDIHECGFFPSISRIGEGYQSNAIMATLHQLGIKIDSTAIPGRMRKDEERWMDWTSTPKMPYFPAKEDYRRPGKDSLKILEVPMSMIPTKVDYDENLLSRYVNLGFHHNVLFSGLRNFIKSNDLLVTITHPFEVASELKSEQRRHPLISFSLDTMEKNLAFSIEECKRINRPVEFIQMSYIPQCNIKIAQNTEP